MTARHLMLIGMMGAGKTTVGAECARRLGRGFVDLDELIETTTGRSIPEIFATDGEPAFRVLERAALADTCASPAPLVISVGGGAMIDPENRRVAQAGSVVVWLRAAPEDLADRVLVAGEEGRRPLLAKGDPVATIERLATLRADGYAAAADAVLEIGNRSAADIVDEVLAELERCDA